MTVRETQKEGFRGEKGKARIASLIVSAVLVLLAVASFLCAAYCEWSAVTKTVVRIMGVLFPVLAVQMILYTFVFDGKMPNFFLSDEETGKCLSVSELTPELVSGRMDAFLSGQTRSKGDLWLPGRLEQVDFGPEGQFRVPVAYKMLLDLAEVDSEGGWRCFCACAPSTVEWIAKTLEACEPAMMKDVMLIKSRFSSDPSKIRGCLVRNASYLKGRMTAYVCTQIKDFDGVQ